MASSPPPYQRRVVDDELDEYLSSGQSAIAIAVAGARGVGKTTTASERAETRYDLDEPGQRAILEADMDRALVAPPPVLIDEWQHVPPVWDKVRRAVDDHSPPGPFLLTGSAAPQEAGVHTGAGRMVTLGMRPLSLAERWPASPTVSLRDLIGGTRPALGGTSSVGLADYVDEILRSGFPGLRELPARLRRTQLQSYLQRVIDRDFPQLGHTPRNPAALRRWMTAYAAAIATTATWEKVRDAATGGHEEKPARSTTLPYRDVLQRLYILDDVPGWKPTRNPIAELAEPPKHHLADPALAASLLGATADALLGDERLGPPLPRDGTLLGALFESLITLSVRVYAAAEARVAHMRMHRGEHEVDLIVERQDGRVVAIEVKLGTTPQAGDVRHLKWLSARIGEDLLDAVVITTGAEAYRRSDGIAVVPAALLGP